MKSLRLLTLAGLLGGLMLPHLSAQQPSAAKAEPTAAEKEAMLKAANAEVESFGWTRGGKAKLGTLAEIAIPAGYRFTDGKGASKMLEFYGNPPSSNYLGLLATENFEEHSVLFSFDETGYVKDDDKDKLAEEADDMLKTFQEGTKAGNEGRRALGLDEMETVGWAVAPRYNDRTQNLEWATKLKSLRTGSVTINHNTRLLGRKGVMKVTLLCSPEELEGLLPAYQKLLSGFAYLEGERYAEYTAGDKLAKYGVTGLVAFGAAGVAAKMGLFAKLGGLFAKLGKGIIIVVVAVGAALKAIFTKLFGKSNPA